MKFPNTLSLIAASALALSALPALAQGHAKHSGAKHAAHKKEQQEWGIAGDAASVSRSVTLSMDDNMRFSPDKLAVRQGETVRFVVRNQGKLLHELVIGTRQTLDAHAAMMLKSPAMAHDEAHMVHVAPGQTGELIWTFNRPGEFDFACLIAGHYQAGMVGKISVAAGSR
jgi:uncharacterized cupredoxin-like copper-binding protein